MKKFLILALLAFVACIIVSCKHKKKELVKKELNVESLISSDKELVAQTYGEYKWYETSIGLKDFLDNDGGEVASVSNIFQVMIDNDVHVVICTHTETEDKADVIHTFWVEDFPMEDIKVTYQEALEIINKVNYPKPHSKHCVLRKQVGPKPCNPQYIFGNQQAQLYVDAVTGEVTDKNPAFND